LNTETFLLLNYSVGRGEVNRWVRMSISDKNFLADVMMLWFIHKNFSCLLLDKWMQCKLFC